MFQERQGFELGEVSVLLDESAVERAPSTPEFYSCLFVVPKSPGAFQRRSINNKCLCPYH
ncbi:hypothetical protein E2C01_055436 [Portunus trituberculatus]|uniref:Uncharacterized protein n=1 Tax=Portunus trituberculatus TaxID=210409 RepID=A0A5B7GUS5_PORTR|nr:hypothetical protein [Portunus trituberculatus]